MNIESLQKCREVFEKWFLDNYDYKPELNASGFYNTQRSFEDFRAFKAAWAIQQAALQAAEEWKAANERLIAENTDLVLQAFKAEQENKRLLTRISELEAK